MAETTEPPEPPEEKILVGRHETPHEQAMFEAGKLLLTESITVGREFCKFMIGVATGAIPIYLALVGLFVNTKEPNTIPADTRLEILLPVGLFLIAAATFVFGYTPTRGNLNIDYYRSIEQDRDATISRRFWASVAGLVLLALGIVGGTIVLVRLLPTE